MPSRVGKVSFCEETQDRDAESDPNPIPSQVRASLVARRPVRGLRQAAGEEDPSVAARVQAVLPQAPGVEPEVPGGLPGGRSVLIEGTMITSSWTMASASRRNDAVRGGVTLHDPTHTLLGPSGPARPDTSVLTSEMAPR